MTDDALERLELRLLFEALHARHGYDFRGYAEASILRRVRSFLPAAGCTHIAELIPKVLRDDALFSGLVQAISVPVTEMFRDPFVYRALRAQVLPVLKTWPFAKIWHAGCATGEEVYSMAVLLAEAELSDRSTIYGTDFNDNALRTARAGIYPLEQMQRFTKSYQEAGGLRSFAEYYHARYESAALDASLKANLMFANHNLTVDGELGEMHLIVCRNVLIYFNRDLQDRVLSMFADSLVHGGFLCIGPKEDLKFSSAADQFEVVDRTARIYRRIGSP